MVEGWHLACSLRNVFLLWARRAGLASDSAAFKALLLAILSTPAISIYGFYTHAGQSYASTSLQEASSFLSAELEAVNAAAKLAQDLLSVTRLESNHQQPFILSIGATPTAHAFAKPTEKVLEQLRSELRGSLEIHAGNYPMLDLQQLHTGLVGPERVANKVLTTILSYYEGRGPNGEDEAICDAGAIALSKDTGPSGGYGDITSEHGKGWYIQRVSQVCWHLPLHDFTAMVVIRNMAFWFKGPPEKATNQN